MSNKMAYVVIGKSGKYEHREEHLVCSYEDKKLAEEHAKKAEKFSENFIKSYKKKSESLSCAQRRKLWREMHILHPNPWDDDMDLFAYDGTCYAVEEISVLKQVPKDPEDE